MTGFTFGPGRWPITSLRGLLLGWLVSEVLAFLLAVKLLGLGGTLLLGLVSTLLGVAMLRRLGVDAARQLRRVVGTGGEPDAVVVDGTLTALGAVLLILPGFVSDAVGLALATPSLRQALAARVLPRSTAPGRAPGRPAAPDVIDLSPNDWRVVDRGGRI